MGYFYYSVGFLCGLFLVFFVSSLLLWVLLGWGVVVFPFSSWQVPAAAPYSRARPISLLNLKRSPAVVLPKEAEKGVRVFVLCQLRPDGAARTGGTWRPRR